MTVLFTEHFIVHRRLPGSVSAAFWVTDMVALLAALRPKGAEQRWGPMVCGVKGGNHSLKSCAPEALTWKLTQHPGLLYTKPASHRLEGEAGSPGWVSKVI